MPYTKRTTGGFKRKRYGRKSTRKPKRYATRRPKRVIRRATRSRAVARIPRLVSDLQYGRKRPAVFRTRYSDMRTFRVTPKHTMDGTGHPCTMHIRLCDLGSTDVYQTTSSIWTALQYNAAPELFERIGKFYGGYHVIGAKVTVTVKPLLGNTNAIDHRDGAGNDQKENDEGMILATVGLTDNAQWPNSLTTPEQLTKYPLSRSHTSIYKRQEAQIGHDVVPGVAGAAAQMLLGGDHPLAPVQNPLAGQAVSMVPGERGKQLSFQTKYSPRKLYGQKASTNGFLRAQMDPNAMGTVHPDHQQFAFIDLREFEVPRQNQVVNTNWRDWTAIPDCFVTIRADYILQVSDPKGIGGTLLDSSTQIINTNLETETDTQLQDQAGGDMDVPEP